MNITLKYRNEIKEIDLNQLQDYQRDNIMRYLNYQRLKILNHILSSNHIPIKALSKLWGSLAKLNAMIDIIVNHQACLN